MDKFLCGLWGFKKEGKMLDVTILSTDNLKIDSYMKKVNSGSQK